MLKGLYGRLHFSLALFLTKAVPYYLRKVDEKSRGPPFPPPTTVRQGETGSGG